MSECPDDETLTAYLEHRAASPDAIEEHLDVCSTCRLVVAGFAAVGAVVDAIGPHGTVILRDRPRTPGDALLGALFGPPVAPGTRLDRYLVEGELGRGGMGVVLAAHDPELDRRVALKVVRPGNDDEASRGRLLREARAMAKLSHPNVVTVHDAGALPDGRVFLAMEYVRGETLRSALAARALPLDRVLALFVEAGRGLAAAHAAGIVHRDFKPENVLVGADGRVRVTDFGIARSARGDERRPESILEDAPPSSGLTGTAVVGTPAYMAPEQCLGLPATPATDQFAFAVALYEAIAGARPFGGDTYRELSDAKLDGRRRPWPDGVTAPRALREAIDRALRRAPEDRHASMAALLAAIEPFARPAARPWRPRALAAAAAAAAVIAGGALVSLRARGDGGTATSGAPVCVDGAAALATVWNDTRRADVRRGLEQRGSPPAAVADAVATLDAQAERWSALHRTACEGARADPRAFALQSACLRRRWNELVEVADVFAAGVPDVDQALARDPLGAVVACANAGALAGVGPLPEDAVGRARIEDAYAQLAHVRAVWGARGTSTALDVLAEDAAALGYAPLEAEVALASAELRGQPSLEEAIRKAEATRDDELVARARRASVRRRAHNALPEVLPGALAAAARLERSDLRADLLELSAAYEQRSGRFAEALVAADEALSLRRAGAFTTGRPPSRWRSDLALVRAESAIEVDDAARARSALADLEDAMDSAVRAAALVAKGRLALSAGDLDAAATALTEAASLADAADPGRTAERRAVAQHALFSALYWSARVEAARGRPDEAEARLLALLQRLVRTGYAIEPIVEARATVAWARLVRGRRPKELLLERARHVYTLVAHYEPAPVVAEALVGVGEALVDVGDTGAAIEELTKAELLARRGSAALRVECTTALLRAATAPGAPASARARAEELARRALADAAPDVAGRAALQAILEAGR